MAIILVTALAVALISLPKKSEIDHNNQDEIEKEEDSSGENTNEQLYASSLTVNLPSVINILVGETVELVSGYYSVQPTSMMSEVKQEIKPRYNCSPFGVTFENSKITANEVGTYNLKISVPRSEGTTFNETILITVYDDVSDAHISQIGYSLNWGENTNINALFTIKENETFELVVVDEKLDFINNTFIPLEAGNSNISFSFKEGYVKYLYSFDLLVKAEPEYSIVIYDVTNNTINVDMQHNEIFYINYDIKDKNNESDPQNLIVDIQDESVIVLRKNLNPLIKFEALQSGTTTIRLICEKDENVFIDITIIVS